MKHFLCAAPTGRVRNACWQEHVLFGFLICLPLDYLAGGMCCVGVGQAAVVWYQYSHYSQVYWWFQSALT